MSRSPTLDKVLGSVQHKQCMWQQAVKDSEGVTRAVLTMYMHMRTGRLFLTQEYANPSTGFTDNEGWEILVPVDNSNSVETTQDALHKYLAGK